MAAELGLLSLTQIQKLAQSHLLQQQQKQNPSSTAGSWMWNPKQSGQEDDDSWEVRAFAEDTGNAMGTTWPPRSYTCTFCRREFRSAQALGGHMNVHRRDRARLHQAPPGLNHHAAASATAAPSTLIIPTQELVGNGGLCLLYSIPNPNGIFSPPNFSGCIDSPSTLLSISTHPTHKSVSPHSIDSSFCHSSNTEPISNDNNHDGTNGKKDSAIEELDLELRLGRGSSPSLETGKHGGMAENGSHGKQLVN